MASAIEQLVGNYDGSQPVSFYDYYNAYGRDHTTSKWNDANPYGFGASVQNFLKGTRSSAEKEYENYLSEFQYRRDQKATAAANAEKYAREDSEIQRRMADYQKAGLNPYLLLTSGSAGAATSSASEYAKYHRASSKSADHKAKSSAITSAMKAIIALAILAG